MRGLLRREKAPSDRTTYPNSCFGSNIAPFEQAVKRFLSGKMVHASNIMIGTFFGGWSGGLREIPQDSGRF